jgi:hypothetical protein
LSTAKTLKLTTNELSLNEDLNITINSLRDGLSSVSVNGKTFEPIDKSKVITELKISINNLSDIDYEYSDLMALEMVFVNNFGDMVFIQYAVMVDFDRAGPKKMFPQGRIVNETLCFNHDKENIPVAITVNRSNYIILTEETDSKYIEILAFLKKNSNIQIMLTRAQFSSFEEIDVFRKENGIDIDDSNRQGLNLLYIGILSKNDSIVNGAIKNGCDLNKKISYSYYGLIEPIHVAFLTDNRNAIDALVNAGVDINQLSVSVERNSPAVLAVRSNNVEALKLLTKYGVDLTKLMIPMNWSPAIPALKFAKDRNMNEMVQYLESLESR